MDWQRQERNSNPSALHTVDTRNSAGPKEPFGLYGSRLDLGNYGILVYNKSHAGFVESTAVLQGELGSEILLHNDTSFIAVPGPPKSLKQI